MIKKIIYILILLIICSNFQVEQSLALVQKGGIKNDADIYAPKNYDVNKVIKSANSSMLLWEKSFIDSDKKFFLEQAMRNYYLATKIDSSKIEAVIGVARVYDAMKLDRLAKEYFFKARNIDPYSAKANFYFANFYFTRNDFLKALFYYKIAYEHGYSYNYDLNYQMAVIYEKIADLTTAKSFYLRALNLNPNNGTLVDKIRLLDDINYSDSQYYLFMKKK